MSYRSSVSFRKNHFQTEVAVKGNATQTKYSPQYDEDRTPAYVVLDWSGKYHFQEGVNSLTAAGGIENILDTYHSTFADWNNILRRSRNFFVQLHNTL